MCRWGSQQNRGGEREREVTRARKGPQRVDGLFHNTSPENHWGGWELLGGRPKPRRRKERNEMGQVKEK